jgi:transcriptional regulator with XRE-family HTH domain
MSLKHYQKEFIKTERLNLGISQVEFCKMLGYPNPSFIAAFEAGEKKVPTTIQKDVCKILKISLFELFLHQLQIFEKEKLEVLSEGFKELYSHSSPRF